MVIEVEMYIKFKYSLLYMDDLQYLIQNLTDL